MSRRLSQTTRADEFRFVFLNSTDSFPFWGEKRDGGAVIVETPHGVTTRFHYSGSYPRVSLLIRIGSYPMWCFTRFH